MTDTQYTNPYISLCISRRSSLIKYINVVIGLLHITIEALSFLFFALRSSNSTQTYIHTYIHTYIMNVMHVCTVALILCIYQYIYIHTYIHKECNACMYSCTYSMHISIYIHTYIHT